MTVIWGEHKIGVEIKLKLLPYRDKFLCGLIFVQIGAKRYKCAKINPYFIGISFAQK